MVGSREGQGGSSALGGASCWRQRGAVWTGDFEILRSWSYGTASPQPLTARVGRQVGGWVERAGGNGGRRAGVRTDCRKGDAWIATPQRPRKVARTTADRKRLRSWSVSNDARSFSLQHRSPCALPSPLGSTAACRPRTPAPPPARAPPSAAGRAWRRPRTAESWGAGWRRAA